MTQRIALDLITKDLYRLFEETFERVEGIYLDKGTSLFETLATISAEEASRPVSARCAPIAAQVDHTTFYIRTLARYMRGEQVGKVDWEASWRRGAVTPEEWAALNADLRAAYDDIRALMRSFTTWEGEEELGGALAIVVHTAYHLGEIRQALCTIKG